MQFKELIKNESIIPTPTLTWNFNSYLFISSVYVITFFFFIILNLRGASLYKIEASWPVAPV